MEFELAASRMNDEAEQNVESGPKSTIGASIEVISIVSEATPH